MQMCELTAQGLLSIKLHALTKKWRYQNLFPFVAMKLTHIAITMITQRLEVAGNDLNSSQRHVFFFFWAKVMQDSNKGMIISHSHNEAAGH